MITGIRIIDPDGWDRKGDFDSSWNERITFEEFWNRAAISSTYGMQDFDVTKEIAVVNFEKYI